MRYGTVADGNGNGERAGMSEEAQQALIDSWSGEVGMELKEEEPFLGQVVTDEVRPGKWNPQLCIAVRPVDFQLKGKTGAFHEFYGLSAAKRSKMGAFLLALQENKITPKGTPVGKGALVGLVCWWVKRDIKFGKSQTGEPIVAEGVLIPVKPASEEEKARAAIEGVAAQVQTPATLDWTPEQAEAVLTAVDGLAPKDFQKAVLTKGSEASKLPRELKQAILSGAALSYLRDAGLATVDDEGKVQRAEISVG